MKSIKKLLAVILALTFVMGLGTVGVQAACSYDVLGDTVWNFTESEKLSDYAYKNDAQGNTDLTIADSGDSEFGKALKFNRAAADKKNLCAIFLMNGNIPRTQAFEISYSIKNTGALAFAHYLRDSNGGYELLKYQNGKIIFNSAEVCKYNTGEWYDVSTTVNVAEGYVNLKIKKHSDSVWEEYDLLSDTLKSKNNTMRTQLNFADTSSATDSVVWIDNYSQNDVNENIKATLDMYDDDFEVEGDSSYLASPTDYRSQWLKQNITYSTFSNTALDNVTGNVATISTTNPSGTANPTMAKLLDFSKATKFVHHWKFKMGGTYDAGLKYFGLRIAKNADGSDDLTQGIIKIQNNTVALGETAQNGFGQVKSGVLYDCEVIYDQINKKIYASILNEEGKRFSNVINLNEHLYLKRIFFCDSTSVTSTMYIDDFTWDIYEADQLTFNGAALKSGAYDSANLDDEVSFTYQGASIKHDATVAVTKGGTAVDASEYTVTAKNNVYTVSFNELEKGGEYTVTLSGVKSLYDETIEDKSITFTAASTGVTATAPAVADSTASTTVTSYYSKGKNVCLLVALYDATGKITEVVTTTAVADARDGEAVSINLSEKTYTTAKAFIWSELSKMVPVEIAQ